MLALPGLVNIHSHPSTEPGYRGVREDHGVPEQQMTGLMERLQAFRLGDDGRQGAATMAYCEMLRAGTTTACDVTVPFDGWLETMAQSGMRFYAAPTFASARWGMASPQTVTWKWDEAGGLAQFEKAKRVMDEAEAHNSGRLDAVVFPAQIDTVTPELFAAGRKHADDSGPPLLDPCRPVGGRGARDDPAPQHDAGAVGGHRRAAEGRHHAGALHPARRPSADQLAYAEGSRPDCRGRRLGGALSAALRALRPRHGSYRPLPRQGREYRPRYRLRAAQSDRGDAARHRRRPPDERGYPQPRHGRRLRGRDLWRGGGAGPRGYRGARRPAWRPTSCWSTSTIR